MLHMGWQGYRGIVKIFAMQKCQLLPFNCCDFSSNQVPQAGCRTRTSQVL